jgi:nucleotidyltransferase-like protein
MDCASAGFHRGHAAGLLTGSRLEGLTGTVCFDWAALDAWFEEDEQVFVHPRSRYVRVDALRSNRSVRVEFGGVVLADSPSPVMVFETGLLTCYYLSRPTLTSGI